MDIMTPGQKVRVKSGILAGKLGEVVSVSRNSRGTLYQVSVYSWVSVATVPLYENELEAV